MGTRSLISNKALLLQYGSPTLNEIHTWSSHTHVCDANSDEFEHFALIRDVSSTLHVIASTSMNTSAST